MDLNLRGKVALVTGSSRGIGKAIARALLAEGCAVAICGRDAESLEAAARDLETPGAQVAAVAADVCRPDDAARLVDACVGQLGGLDILVNSVGGALGATHLLESTDEDWRGTFELKVVQTVRMMRLAVPHMRDRGGGAVVNIASISGWVPQLVGRSQSGAAKAALIFDTERWALEFVPAGVRVNTVSPGSIIAPGNVWDLYRRREPETFAEYEREGFPMGRPGVPRGGGRRGGLPVLTQGHLDQRPPRPRRRPRAARPATRPSPVLILDPGTVWEVLFIRSLPGFCRTSRR